jgi:5-amino-6-(5-phosphoribosylamino)uracil reductase
MVATLDGKTVVGGAGTTRLIGSETDHALMTQIEDGVDAVLVGAGLVRDDNPGYPRLNERRLAQRAARGVRPAPWWIIITTQAQFAGTPRLLEENSQRVAICTTTRVPHERLRALQAHCRVLVLGEERVNPLALGRALRHELDIRSVCCLGGASLNGYLVDSACP